MGAISDSNETAFEQFKVGDLQGTESPSYQEAKTRFDNLTNGHSQAGRTFTHPFQVSFDNGTLTISKWAARRAQARDADKSESATYRHTTAAEDGQFDGAKKGEEWVEYMDSSVTMQGSETAPLELYGSHVIAPPSGDQGAVMFSHFAKTDDRESRVETLHGGSSCALDHYLDKMK